MKRFLIIILAGMAALGASAGWAQGGAGPYVAPMMTPVVIIPEYSLKVSWPWDVAPLCAP